MRKLVIEALKVSGFDGRDEGIYASGIIQGLKRGGIIRQVSRKGNKPVWHVRVSNELSMDMLFGIFIRLIKKDDAKAHIHHYQLYRKHVNPQGVF